MLSILRKNISKQLQYCFRCNKSSIPEILKQMAARKRGLFVPDTPRHIKMKRSRKEIGLEMKSSPLISILAVSNGFLNTPKSVVIRTDNQHYLIGCGESTQRILMELSTKFLKIGHVFVTNESWNQTGGIIGLAISLETGGSEELIFHAPFDLKEHVESMRSVQAFQTLRLTQQDYNDNETFEDESFTVRQCIFPDNNDLCNSKSLSNKNRCFYIFDTKPLPPKLSPEKCAFFRVPMNNLRSRLKNGEDVVLDDGTLVRSVDVTESSYANERIVILDCPEYSCEKSLDYLWSVIREHLPNIVVHFSSAKVLQNPVYHDFMRDKLNCSYHIILDETVENVESTNIYNMQLILNNIHSGFFPLFPLQRKVISGLKNGSVNDATVPVKHSYWEHENSERIVNISTGIYFDVRKKVVNAEQVFNFLGKKSLDEIELNTDAVKSDLLPALIFLGTGSACPSTLRNVSCVLLNISPTASLLLDCGEGSLIQMTRIYGDRIDEILRNIRCIFISHMHPDHHGGIFGIISARLSAFKKVNSKPNPLLISCPSNLIHRLSHMIRAFSPELLSDDLMIIRNKEALLKQFSSESLKLLDDIGIVRFLPVAVDHIFDSHALVLKHKDGWKIVFSGDCRPSAALVDAGKNADVLIHEATLEDDMGDDAKLLKHSTFSEAINVGRDMGAKFIILWHFSQRYSKVPFFSDSVKFDSVAVSFDNMQVPLANTGILSSLLEPLRVTFASEFEILEQKRLRYMMKNMKNSTQSDNQLKSSSSLSNASSSTASFQEKEAKIKTNGVVYENFQ